MDNTGNTKHITQKLFTESLRPKKLEDCILVPRVRKIFEKGLNQNSLLWGSGGIGKSSLTRILTAGYTTLEINASLETGIDTIRDKVVGFASQSSLFDGEEQIKLIVLEECDGLSLEAWKALRATIEKYHKTVRFIANCNYIEKIPDPIKSRFDVITLEPINKEEELYLLNEYINKIKKVLTALNITYTEDAVVTFIKNSFPDMRTILNKVQNLYNRDIKELTTDTLASSYDCSDLFNIIINKPDAVNNYKQLVGDWSNRADDAIISIGKEFPDFIMNTHPEFNAKLPLILIATAEYNSMLATSIDKFVTLLGLVFKLQIIINS